MLKSFVNYGAVAAKARAMYGEQLTPGQWDDLVRRRNPGDIAAYLRTLPSYSEALAPLGEGIVSSRAFEAAARRAILRDIAAFAHFTVGADKKLMLSLLHYEELERLISFITGLKRGDRGDGAFAYSPLPAQFRQYSLLDPDRQTSVRNAADLLAAMRPGVYRNDLKLYLDSPAGNASFDPSALEIILHGRYFNETLKIAKGRGMESAAALRQWAGTRVDCINLMRALRLKRSFPSVENGWDYLLPPVRGIGQRLASAALGAASYEEAASIVAASPKYGSLAAAPHNRIEQEYHRRMCGMYVSLLRGEPSALTPLAVLGLKKNEIRNLLTLSECVSYRLPPDDIRGLLVLTEA